MTRQRLSTRDRVRIFQAADGCCHICEMKIQPGQEWDVSHPTPLELGGADDDANRRPAHRRCHRILTATEDVPAIRKAQRREARHLGAKRTSRPIPGSKASGWKRKLNGEVTRR